MRCVPPQRISASRMRKRSEYVQPQKQHSMKPPPQHEHQSQVLAAEERQIPVAVASIREADEAQRQRIAEMGQLTIDEQQQRLTELQSAQAGAEAELNRLADQENKTLAEIETLRQTS